MIGADADPALVVADVVHAVRVGATHRWVDKVVDSNLLRLALGVPLASAILVLAHQLFLLRVHRDHRLAGSKRSRHGGVDVLELRVAIWTLVALDDLGVRLQAVALILEQSPHDDVTDRMTTGLEFNIELLFLPSERPELTR